jgi:hypothetical protein
MYLRGIDPTPRRAHRRTRTRYWVLAIRRPRVMARLGARMLILGARAQREDGKLPISRGELGVEDGVVGLGERGQPRAPVGSTVP